MLVIWDAPRSLFGGNRALDAALGQPFAFDARTISQAATWGLAGLVSAMLILHPFSTSRTLRLPGVLQSPIRYYFIFGIWALLSATYSVAPGYTIALGLKVPVAILILCWCGASSRSSLKPLTLLLATFTAQAVAILVLYLIAPGIVGKSYTGAYRLSGGIFDDYGASAIIAGILGAGLAFYGRTRAVRLSGWTLQSLAWILIILSQTRSAILILALSLLLAILLTRSRLAIGSVATIIASAGTVVLVLPGLPTDRAIEYVTRGGEGFATLSGRTLAFDYLMDSWRTSPIVGHGFGSGARTQLISFVAKTGVGIGDAHDALSAVLVDLGVVGALLLILAFLSASRVLWIQTAREAANGRIGGVTFILLCLWVNVALSLVVSRSIAGPSPVFVVLVATLWARTHDGRVVARRARPGLLDRVIR